LLRDDAVNRKGAGSMMGEKTTHPQNNYQISNSFISKFTGNEENQCLKKDPLLRARIR
jgi:hypothetical protein